MVLTGERRIEADRATVWTALNDPEVLKASIPGCESIEKTGDNEYAVNVLAALGPVRAKFAGRLLLEDVVAPESYTLRFEGQGGPAGFAKGSSKVTLFDDTGATLLRYAVTAQVGGRIAQVGNRLIDSAALKLADDFFATFEKEVSGTSSQKAVPGTTFPKGARDASLRWVVAVAVVALAVAGYLALR